MSERLQLIMKRYSPVDSLQITLLTDYFSPEFEALYRDQIHRYQFRAVVFNSEAYSYYENSSIPRLSMKISDVIPDWGTEYDDPTPPPTTTTTTEIPSTSSPTSTVAESGAPTSTTPTSTTPGRFEGDTGSDNLVSSTLDKK